MSWLESIANGVPTIVGIALAAILLLSLVSYVIKNRNHHDKYKLALNIIIRTTLITLFVYIGMTGNNGGAVLELENQVQSVPSTSPTNVEVEIRDRTPQRATATETSDRLEALRQEQKANTSLNQKDSEGK